MNSTQRKFLIDKIQEETKKKIEQLKKQKSEFPSASNYIFKAILDGTLELQSQEHILEVLKQRALKSIEGRNWLSGDTNGFEAKRAIKFEKHEDILILPKEFKIEVDRVRDFNRDIDNQIDALQTALNGIEMRIQLASDSTLKNLINEVDDMGDIKLIDTTVKLLNK
jgi:hypothetical protein